MNNDSPQKAILVVFIVALVCSVMVSVAVINLRPIQLAYKFLERAQHIVQLTGLADAGVSTLSNKQLLAIFTQLDARVVDIDGRSFSQDLHPATFDQRKAASDPALSVAIPAKFNVARLGQRSRFATVYLVWKADQLQRIILPVHGQGMWSTLYGYLALDADLNTIAAVTFYEQGETPGLGDQILRAGWQAQWQGQRVWDKQGSVRFRVAARNVAQESAAERHEVDALSGATVTADGVTNLMHYWFGAHGFQPFLQYLHEVPPVNPKAKADNRGKKS
jgi:Na+-transporting NADH:ubiquinone oxidoreductase subunit C